MNIMETSRVVEAGAYRMPHEAYHADPCPTASLNQSTAKVLLERSPLRAWWQHPRLNPQFERDEDPKFDLGSAAHRLLLGEGRDICILPFDDYRTKAAQVARDEARAMGKTPMLTKQADRAADMVAALRDQAPGFFLGHSEVAICWPEGRFWFRSLIDNLSADCLLSCDYKTTDHSIAPHQIDRVMLNAGWDVQAAMHERALNAVDPDNAGRRKFVFIAQETEEPYPVVVYRMTEAVMTMGRKKLAHAIGIWRSCMTGGTWPSYPSPIDASYPQWAEAKWLEREIEADSRADDKHAQLAVDYLMGG
jgi:hypothetical protein